MSRRRITIRQETLDTNSDNPGTESLERLSSKALCVIQLIIEHNSSTYRLLWQKVSSIETKPKTHTFTAGSCLWFSIVIHLLMTLMGAFTLFLRNLLRNPSTIKPELKEVLSEAWFEITVGVTFVFFLGSWLILMFLLKGIGNGDLLLLGGITVFCLISSIELTRLLYRVLHLSLGKALTSLGIIPLFILGMPWGLVIFLIIGLLDIAYSAWGIAKNIRLATKRLSHLLITPILLYLLVSAVTGVTDYQSELKFDEALALLSTSTIDFLGIQHDFEAIRTLFHWGNYGTLNFSFSAIQVDQIQSASVGILQTLARIDNNSRRVLDLLQKQNPISAYYCRKTTEALLAAAAFVKTWIQSAELASFMFYHRDVSSKNVAALQRYRNLLSQNAEKLDDLFRDPLFTLPLLSGWRQGIIDGVMNMVSELDWAVRYFPSLNLILNVSQRYDKANDSLAVNLNLRNVGEEPIRISPLRVGTCFEWIDWLNYSQLDKIYENSYKPSAIHLLGNASEINPGGSAIISMNFTEIGWSLSKYKWDFRTFVCPSIFIIFPYTYIQINAAIVFKESL